MSLTPEIRALLVATTQELGAASALYREITPAFERGDPAAAWRAFVAGKRAHALAVERVAALPPETRAQIEEFVELGRLESEYRAAAARAETTHRRIIEREREQRERAETLERERAETLKRRKRRERVVSVVWAILYPIGLVLYAAFVVAVFALVWGAGAAFD